MFGNAVNVDIRSRVRAHGGVQYLCLDPGTEEGAKR
jgi:hypothetical protein